MITVNAAGCGKGKSTNNKKFIASHNDSNFLIIVPSLALANEYADTGLVIHSENTNNVKSHIYQAIEANSSVIVITQKAFLDFERKTFLCSNRTILQDEHLEPFYICKWRMDNHEQWHDMFEIGSVEKSGWYGVNLNMARIDQYIASKDMLDNKQFMLDLIATPQNIYTNKPTIESDSMLFRVISPHIYEGANNIHIACANFKATRQYHLWTTVFNEEFNVKIPFVPYVAPNLTIHFASQKRNSKTFNRSNSIIKDNVISYIKSKCDSPVYVDNNAYETESDWQRVNHNCHGINQFRDEAHIAILSAINYDNLATAFLIDVAGMTSEQIRYSLIGEIAHQVVMRGTLRNDNQNECHVYLMEMDLAAYLTRDIFSQSKYEFIDDTDRPERPPALTPAERKKATLIRKNFPDYREMPTDNLMKESIWSFTNTNGKYSKIYLELMAERQEYEKRMAST
ncbi:hypothetical protein H3H36_23285 [Duganella sp. FT3S]|uniref:Uncharacterized protein n=1 Tax=Rugamonas fusca TaxID=2758568 RepID=A0A7W2ELW6_9BURK|nr:hypothetical protein [Rugamonas fusca]MBA5608277.1 hypothetical protein [Rugamonas fusca]